MPLLGHESIQVDRFALPYPELDQLLREFPDKGKQAEATYDTQLHLEDARSSVRVGKYEIQEIMSGPLEIAVRTSYSVRESVIYTDIV